MWKVYGMIALKGTARRENTYYNAVNQVKIPYLTPILYVSLALTVVTDHEIAGFTYPKLAILNLTLDNTRAANQPSCSRSRAVCGSALLVIEPI